MAIISIDHSQFRRIIKGSNDGAKVIYETFFENFKRMGIIDLLSDRSYSVEEVCDKLSISWKIKHRIQVALEGLCEAGVLCCSSDKYRVINDSLPWTDIDTQDIAYTFGEEFISQYVPFFKEGIIFQDDFALRFDESFSVMWQAVLNSPGNLVWRDAAVDWIARSGNSVMDLGFGTPDSLRQLSEIVGDDGLVHGFEESEHFVEMAKNSLGDFNNIGTICHHNINQEFSFFDQKVDGLMFIGALHFVPDAEGLIKEIDRITNEDARMVLGTFFVKRPCFAGPAFHMHRSLFDPVPDVHDINELESLLIKYGFEIRLRTNFSAYTSLYCEKMPCSYSEVNQRTII